MIYSYLIGLQLLDCRTRWIDVCQNNPNLLASGGEEFNVKIFDRRESKIVEIFEKIHSGRRNNSGYLHNMVWVSDNIRLYQLREMEFEGRYAG